MQEEKRKIYNVIAITVLVSLLLSCIAGAIAGGTAGFLVGRRQGVAAAERVLERELGDLPRFHMELPIPWQEERPFPSPEGEIPGPPREGLPPEIEGAFVQEVIAGTPAEQAGLEPGDVILAIDRTPIDRYHPLPDVIRQYEPGDLVTVRFWRANQENSIRIRLAEHPEDPGQAYLGVYFEMIARPDPSLPGG